MKAIMTKGLHIALLAPLVGLCGLADASITSSTGLVWTQTYDYFADTFTSSTLHQYVPGSIGYGAQSDPYAGYGFDGSGYAATGAYANSTLITSTASILDVHWDLNLQASAFQNTLDGRNYVAQAYGSFSEEFILDSPGTLLATELSFSSQFSGYAYFYEGYNNWDLGISVDGTFYGHGANVPLDAGYHRVYLTVAAYADAGSFYNYRANAFWYYAPNSEASGGLTYDIQVTSAAVPEPTSLALLGACGLGLLRRGKSRPG